MSDDIVTRLRALTEVGSWVALGEWDSVTKEAANYIETLRREVHHWYEKWRDLEVGRAEA